MSNYERLLEQRKALEQEIAQARREEIGEAVTTIKGLVAQFDLKASDIFGGTRRSGEKTAKSVAAKYLDPETGKTWTGRGKEPLWIAGKDRNQFSIATE